MSRTIDISISYEVFEEDDFDDYRDRIREWLRENTEFFERDVSDVWCDCKDHIYFNQDLCINFNGSELSDSATDRIFDDLCDLQWASIDEAFESQFYAFFQEEKAKYFGGERLTLDNE